MKKREILPNGYKLKYSGIFFSIVLYFVLFIVWIIARDTMYDAQFKEFQVFVLAIMVIWSLIFIMLVYKFISTNKKLRLRRKFIKNAVLCADGRIKEYKKYFPDRQEGKKNYYQLMVEYTDTRDNEVKTTESEWYARNPETFTDNPEFEVKVHIRKTKRPIVSVYRLIEDEEKKTVEEETVEEIIEEQVAEEKTE